MSIPVVDPVKVTADPTMPFLARALEPIAAAAQLAGALPADFGQLQLQAIRVRRHKPGKRCLIEYELAVWRPGAEPQVISLLGKVRAKGLDEKGYQVLQALRAAGFDEQSQDGISLPAPVATVPAWQMWLQHKVAGPVATQLLAGAEGVALVRRIAEAAHKLHQAQVPAPRRHTIADELQILHDRLKRVAAERPQWQARLERLLNRCEQLAATLPQPTPCGIHRDFYADQVIVNGERLYLLDFDLYCSGDPALDIGNFIGHITEHSLRYLGQPDALAACETAMLERFVALAGPATRRNVEAYALLTLARHIYLSTQFADRRQFTEDLLELCEQRLGLTKQPVAAASPRPPIRPAPGTKTTT